MRIKELILENWYLKLFALVLAIALWALIAQESTSETFFEVPVEFQNVPPGTEVISDTAKKVEVRLRGPSSLIREIAAKDISTVVDLAQVPGNGEKFLPLNPQHVHTPFGIEVLRVTPSRVHVSMEPTAMADLTVVPQQTGHTAPGYEVEHIEVKPDTVRAEGPASHIHSLTSVMTTAVDLSNKKSSFSQNIDLDLPDPLVRFPEAGPFHIEVKIRKRS